MWLKEMRLSEQLSQARAGELAGISQQLFSFIENGERRPSPEVAKRIAVALDFEKYGFDWTKFFEGTQ